MPRKNSGMWYEVHPRDIKYDARAGVRFDLSIVEQSFGYRQTIIELLFCPFYP